MSRSKVELPRELVELLDWIEAATSAANQDTMRAGTWLAFKRARALGLLAQLFDERRRPWSRLFFRRFASIMLDARLDLWGRLESSSQEETERIEHARLARAERERAEELDRREHEGTYEAPGAPPPPIDYYDPAPVLPARELEGAP